MLETRWIGDWEAFKDAYLKARNPLSQNLFHVDTSGQRVATRKKKTLTLLEARLKRYRAEWVD